MNFRFSCDSLWYVPQVPFEKIGYFPEALNVNRLVLKLNRFVRN